MTLTPKSWHIQVVTPDLKLGSEGALVHIDLAAGRRRLGGSALGQVRVHSSSSANSTVHYAVLHLVEEKKAL